MINRVSVTNERSRRQKAEARVLQLEAVGRRILDTCTNQDLDIEFLEAYKELERLLEPKPKKEEK